MYRKVKREKLCKLHQIAFFIVAWFTFEMDKFERSNFDAPKR